MLTRIGGGGFGIVQASSLLSQLCQWEQPEISGVPWGPGVQDRGTKGSRGAERAVGASEEMEVPEYSGRFRALRGGRCRHQPSAPGIVSPRQCGEEPRAVRPPPLPPSSPAPRQYARELMTTGVIIPQPQSTGISRTNKPGVPRILRALRGQFLVTWGGDSTPVSARFGHPRSSSRRKPGPSARTIQGALQVPNHGLDRRPRSTLETTH